MTEQNILHEVQAGKLVLLFVGIILCMCPVNERWRYNVDMHVTYTEWSLEIAPTTVGSLF